MRAPRRDRLRSAGLEISPRQIGKVSSTPSSSGICLSTDHPLALDLQRAGRGSSCSSSASPDPS
jgi:hypothetical protein